MGVILFKDYLKAVNDFAEKNPESLEMGVVSERDHGVHGVYTNEPVAMGVFKHRSFCASQIELFCEDEPQDNFKPDTVCVGIV